MFAHALLVFFLGLVISNYRNIDLKLLARLLPELHVLHSVLLPLLILMTFSLLMFWFWLGENWRWSLLGLKGSKGLLTQYSTTGNSINSERTWGYNNYQYNNLSQRCITYNGLQHFGYVKISEILFKGLYVMYDHSNVHSSKIHAVLKRHLKNLSLPIKSRFF